MADGRIDHAWTHTAEILRAVSEPYRDRDEHPEPFAAWEFNPTDPRNQRNQQRDTPEPDNREEADRQLREFAQFIGAKGV